jgi:phage FluMu gp28-like protein
VGAALDIANDLPLLLPFQQEWFCDESDVKVIVKSRRIGISWTSAAKHVFVAAEGLMDGFYVGYTEDQGEEFIRDVADWAKVVHGVALEIQRFVLEDVDPETGNTQAIKAFRVDFASGKRVVALSSRPRNLRGKQGLVTLDEAAFHDDLRGLLKAAIALLMWGGQVEIISTHLGEENEFAKLIDQIRAGEFDYSLHQVTLDDALKDGLFKRICMVRGVDWSERAEAEWREKLIKHYGDAADEELFCIPASGSGSYFSRDVIEDRMVTGRRVLRYECSQAFAMLPEAQRKATVQGWIDQDIKPLLKTLPSDREHYLGQDFGRVSDLSAIAPVTLTAELIRDVPFMVEMANVPFDQQRQVLWAVLDGLPRFQKAHLDASGNGAHLAEVTAQKYGAHRIEQVKIGENWHMVEWPALRTAVEEGKFRLPSDTLIRDDFALVKRVNGIPKIPNATVVKNPNDPKARGQRRHGDGAIACAMANASTRERKAVPTTPVHIRGL